MAKPAPSFASATLAVITASLLVGAWSSAARAHDESVSTSTVEVESQVVTWKVDVGIAGLAKAVTLPAPEGRLDAAGLVSAAPAIGDYLSRGIAVSTGGKPFTLLVGPLEPRYDKEGERSVLSRAEQTFHLLAPGPFDELSAKISFFADLTPAHRSIVRVRWGEATGQFVRLGQPTLHVTRASLSPSVWAVGSEFFHWGVHHIFVGYDHIAFLLALLLAVTSLRQLIVIVSAFTVAHSFTLLLAAWNIVAFPPRLTEALIAASIVYVAAENLTRVGATARHRAILTFAFGLIHGLGFATELRNRLAERGGAIVWPVVTFNLGVEAGQLIIVAVVYPLLRKLRAAPTEAAAARRQRRLRTVASIPLLLLGLFWLVARLGG